VPDPFRSAPDARLYRTGDRCRWLADGSVEFLGRLDQQVKLRGYRIEMGEIESLLGTHPAVHESAVILHGEDGSNQRLVAYVSARANMGLPTAEVLRRYLQERLPEYMVPSTFVLPAMLYTGLKGYVRVHLSLAACFVVLWCGTFITGIFFLPSQ